MREEYAHGLDLENESRTFPHRLDGPCLCGVAHGSAHFGPSKPKASGSGKAAHITATYVYTDPDGREVYEVRRWDPKNFTQARIEPDGRRVSEPGCMKGVPLVLYRLPELRAAIAAGDPIWIVEGEKDADRLHAEGLVATCNTGGAGKWRPEYADCFRDAPDVRIVADRDAPGYRHATNVAASLRGAGPRIRVLESPVGKDVSDLLDAGNSLENLVEINPEDRQRELRETGASTNGTGEREEEKAPRSPILVPLAKVTPTKMEFLWPGRMPVGKLIILEGDPGLGKTVMLCDLAARITRGDPMPDGAQTHRGSVLWLSAEDDLADTIRPRHEAALADLSLISVFSAVRSNNPAQPPEFPIDADMLECAIRERAAVLVVIDPLVAFLGSETNSHRDQDVRRALAPLAAIAERTRAAIVLVRHLNKGSSSNPLYRGGGSIGIIAAARAGLLVARDPDDDTRRILAVTKFNVGLPAPSLGFCIRGSPEGVAEVQWLGASAHTASSVLAVPQDGEERSAVDEARDWLADFLGSGARAANDVKKAARAVGISDKTLERAKRALSAVARKQSFSGAWVWEMKS
jgi:hypothetical protein